MQIIIMGQLNESVPTQPTQKMLLKPPFLVKKKSRFPSKRFKNNC